MWSCVCYGLAFSPVVEMYGRKELKKCLELCEERGQEQEEEFDLEAGAIGFQLHTAGVMGRDRQQTSRRAKTSVLRLKL